MEDKFIDVEKAIASKNPKLLKWMPGFVLRYLKRILHEKDINDFIKKNEDQLGIDFCKAVRAELDLKTRFYGVENVPKDGGCIFASNHPLGGVDAMVIVTALEDVRTDIKFIVNDLLMNLKNLQGMFVGVNKHGINSKDSLKMVDELFASNKAVFVFPAGLVSRRKKGVVKDLEWKKTFVTRARKHNKPIVPVYIDGELTNFFYRLANFRKAVGIKANLEMLYLADELYKQHGKTLNIVFGKPIDVKQDFPNKSDKEIASHIKEMVYAQNVMIKS